MNLPSTRRLSIELICLRNGKLGAYIISWEEGRGVVFLFFSSYFHAVWI